MALVEWNSDGPPRVVHASLDCRATWERTVIEDRDWSDSPNEFSHAIEDALPPLG